MKRIIISLFLLASVSGAALAQDSNREVGTVNKDGDRILPKKGDFAFGVSTNPFFDYIGNMFNAAPNSTAPELQGMNFSLNGKYFLTDRQAVRVRLGMDFDKSQYKNLVQNDAMGITNPDVIDPTVNDVYNKYENQFALFVGYEFRRGYGRLQGFWGAELGIGFTKFSDVYEYANAMTAENPAPTTTTNFYYQTYGPVARRILNSKWNGFNAAVGIFAGVEYFFAPKMSIGAELGLCMKYEWDGQRETEVEFFDNQLGGVQTQTNRTAAGLSSTFALTTATKGEIFMTFYF